MTLADIRDGVHLVVQTVPQAVDNQVQPVVEDVTIFEDAVLLVERPSAAFLLDDVFGEVTGVQTVHFFVDVDVDGKQSRSRDVGD